MDKIRIAAIIKNALAIIGSFLIGKELFGAQVDQGLWEIIGGAVMVLISFFMSFATNLVTKEKWQDALRVLFVSVGAALTAGGWVKPEQIELWGGALTMLGTLIYEWISRKKTQDIAKGATPINELTK